MQRRKYYMYVGHSCWSKTVNDRAAGGKKVTQLQGINYQERSCSRKKIRTRLEINTEHDCKRKTIQNTEYSCSYRRRTLQEKLHEETAQDTDARRKQYTVGHSWIGRIHDICSCQRKTGEQSYRKRTRKDMAVGEMRDDISVGEG